MAAKKKLTAAVAAVATSAALLLGGTLAWQSANQTALNEASDVVNPGGRLHDDFYIDDNGDYNADIYVENFAEEDIFARVKLQEYMEVVLNYNTAGEKNYLVLGTQDDDTDTPGLNIAELPDGTQYEREYVTHTSYALNGAVEEAGVDYRGDTEPANYWTWTMGSPDSAEVYYMPTFNMNKDSLVADRNGMYVDRIGGISNRGQEQYYTDDRTDLSWTVWTDGEPKDGTEIWDVDYNDDDEVKYDFEHLQTYVDAENITTIDKTHTAKLVGTTNGFISMTDWLKKLNNGDDTADYWVYDEDGSGWIYWSSPIEAKSATGLLLDSIELNDVMDDTWYYAINAIAQFVTADDVGKTDDTGFYGVEEENPSESAEILLEAIGVDMSGEEEGPQTYDLLLNWNEDNEVYAKPNDRIVLSVEPYTFTDEETGEETVYTGDLSSVTLYDADTTYELTKDADYLYDPVTFTLIVTNDQISGVRVVEAEGNLGGYVYFTDSGEEEEEEEEHYDELVLKTDTYSNIVKGGEMIRFQATVYDNNGDIIANTEDVTFSMTETTASGASAASIVEESYMIDNFLIVADNVLERDVETITVSATYVDSETDTIYKNEQIFLTKAEESPLKTTFKFNGVAREHLPGNNPVFQVFTHAPNEDTFEFGSTLNSETVTSVNWGLLSDNEYGAKYTTIEKDGFVYALSNESWVENWIPLKIGTEIAKINKTTGEFKVLIGNEFPMSATFSLTSSVTDENGLTYEREDYLFIARRVVEFQLREAGNDTFADTTYTSGQESTVKIAPYIIKEGTMIPSANITEDMITDWIVYEGEYYRADSTPLDSSQYSIVYSGSGIWTLTLNANVNAPDIGVRASYNYGEATPHASDGIYKADLHIVEKSSIPSTKITSVTVYDEDYNEESTYVPSKYAKIILSAEGFNDSGDYIYTNSYNWAIYDGNKNPVENARIVYNGSSAELQLRGATAEKIVVEAAHCDENGSIVCIGHYTLTAES